MDYCTHKMEISEWQRDQIMDKKKPKALFFAWMSTHAYNFPPSISPFQKIFYYVHSLNTHRHLVRKLYYFTSSWNFSSAEFSLATCSTSQVTNGFVHFITSLPSSPSGSDVHGEHERLSLQK